MEMLSDGVEDNRCYESTEDEITRWLATNCENLNTDVFKWFQLNAHNYPRIA